MCALENRYESVESEELDIRIDLARRVARTERTIVDLISTVLEFLPTIYQLRLQRGGRSVALSARTEY